MKLPEPGINNIWYRDCVWGPVIVFLHGVLSDSRGCWLYQSADPTKNVYWPELICSDRRFDGISVYLAGYYTAVDAGPYEIRNCSDEVFAALARREVGKLNSVLDRETIIFVCHSTGGIVARYLLDTHSDAFVQKRVGLVLIASPSIGAKDANRLSLIADFYQNALGKQLQWGHFSLRDLDSRFRDLVYHKQRLPQLRGIEAYENHFIIHSKRFPFLRRSTVVTEESAGRYFGAPRLLRNTDHFSAVKPTGVDHPAYQLLVDFLQREFELAQESSAGTVLTPAEEQTQPAAELVPILPIATPPKGKQANSSAVRLRLELSGHRGRLNRVLWSPDGDLLATTSFDCTVGLWDTGSGKSQGFLEGHTATVYCVAWHPKSPLLASGSQDRQVRIWDVRTRKTVSILEGHESGIYSIGWSPDGSLLASGDLVATIRVWDAASGQPVRTLDGHLDDISCLEWSHGGGILASASDDRTIRLWRADDFSCAAVLRGHTAEVTAVAWMRNGEALASSSLDHTIRVWNPRTGRLKAILEGHQGPVKWVCYSRDDRVIASRSADRTVRFWDADSYKQIGMIATGASIRWEPTLAFHPTQDLLATTAASLDSVNIWELDISRLLLEAQPADETMRYKSAKIILLGDHAAGKTCLARALMKRPWVPTESTHARQIYLLSSEIAGDTGVAPREVREVYLWDLAGQPDYRLLHQLHLSDMTVMVMAVDLFNSEDPVNSIRYWIRSAKQASLNLVAAGMVPRLLVATRTDQRPVNPRMVSELADIHGFSGYSITSAKTGDGIDELRSLIHKHIHWQELPAVISDSLLHQLKDFVAKVRSEGEELIPEETLYRLFLAARRSSSLVDVVPSHFRSCLLRLQSHGIIRLIDFGGLVLLEPRLLDSYAAALILAAKADPSGLGTLVESKVRNGEFPLPNEERITARNQEPLLVLAVLEHLTRSQIAFRVPILGEVLVAFPSQSQRAFAGGASPARQFQFSGSVTSIYTTLVVSLSTSAEVFTTDLYRGAASFHASTGQTYSVRLSELDDSTARLDLFWSNDTSHEMSEAFVRIIWSHLKRSALPETVAEVIRHQCPSCSAEITDQMIAARRQRGFDHLLCPVCDAVVPLPGAAEQLALKLAADGEIERWKSRKTTDSSQYVYDGKVATLDYDVWLCCDEADSRIVADIADTCKRHGILPWVRENCVKSGEHWTEVLDRAFGRLKAAVVFVGASGKGPWESQPESLFLARLATRRSVIIPVLLVNAPGPPALPSYLATRPWLDYRQMNEDITGKLLDSLSAMEAVFLQTKLEV